MENEEAAEKGPFASPRHTARKKKKIQKKRLKDTVGHILKHNTLIVWFGFLFRKISVSFHLLAHHARKICLCIE